MLMDTQGAWDARMSKERLCFGLQSRCEEQSATIFGLTTLLASRLIYNAPWPHARASSIFGGVQADPTG